MNIELATIANARLWPGARFRPPEFRKGLSESKKAIREHRIALTEGKKSLPGITNLSSRKENIHSGKQIRCIGIAFLPSVDDCSSTEGLFCIPEDKKASPED